MKNFIVVSVGLFLAALSGVVSAAPDKPYYVAALVGNAKSDVGVGFTVPTTGGDATQFRQDSEPLALGFNAGYRFTDTVAVELHYLFGLTDKAFNDLDATTVQYGSMDISSSALGAYSVFTFGGDAYFKIKTGLASAAMDFETDLGSYSDSTVGLSYGIAVGQRIGGLGTVEFQFMRYPEVKIDRGEFASDIAGGNAQVTSRIRSRAKMQSLMIGYNFEF